MNYGVQISGSQGDDDVIMHVVEQSSGLASLHLLDVAAGSKLSQSRTFYEDLEVLTLCRG